MPAEKTEAIVIRQTDFSETSRVVSLFTRDFGRISALAKGARRLKGPFEAALDLLARCQIVFLRKSSSSLDLLTEAQLVRRFQPGSGTASRLCSGTVSRPCQPPARRSPQAAQTDRAGDLRSASPWGQETPPQREASQPDGAGQRLVRLYGGYYVAELLGGLTEEYDPHCELYDEACLTLTRLENGPRPQVALARFELCLLREIGQLPAFDACLACGRPADQFTEHSWSFWVSQGGLVCRGCQKEEFDSKQITTGTIAVLRQLASESPAVFERLVVSPAQWQQIRPLVTSAVSHALGRRPKMLRYLQM